MCTALCGALLALSACASVPPQIAITHRKEQKIIASPQAAHLAMTDAYIDRKIADNIDKMSGAVVALAKNFAAGV